MVMLPPIDEDTAQHLGRSVAIDDASLSTAYSLYVPLPTPGAGRAKPSRYHFCNAVCVVLAWSAARTELAEPHTRHELVEPPPPDSRSFSRQRSGTSPYESQPVVFDRNKAP